MSNNNKPLQAEYLRTDRENIFGEPEVIRIRDISTYQTKGVTAKQLAEAIQKGLIEVKYIKVRPDGTIKITKNMKRKPQPKKIDECRKKLIELDEKKTELEKQYSANHNKETYNALIKLNRQLDELLRQPEYYEKYEKLQADKYLEQSLGIKVKL